MHLTFLGTAAAEGYPGLFCTCANCQEARRLGGKNLRLRSALLVNDDLLIDCGPDLLAAAQRLDLNLWKVTTGLVTHAHMDHFFSGHFGMRREPFSGKLPPPTLHLFAPQDVEKLLRGEFPDLEALHMELQTVQAFDAWASGGYRFIAYRAYHALESLEALFYSIDDGQRAFLYATDTGPFPEDTRQALAGRSFDLVILEETLGDGQYDQHLGFDSFLEQVHWLRAEKMIRPGGRVIAHHFSHASNPVHEKLEAILNPHGIEVAYDGLMVAF